MAASLESPALTAVREFLAAEEQRAWLVGGSVRDLLLEREPEDIDLVTPGDPEKLARRLADTLGGSFFTMSEEFRTCRVVAPGGAPVYDFAACRGAGIEEDLGERDFTINALAVELPGGAEIIDPLGGRRHLGEHRLVAVRDSIFDHDPLRLLRAVRLEREPGLAISDSLATLIRSRAKLAALPAPERTLAELDRLLGAPGVAASVRRLDELGLLAIILPELTALKGVEQNRYHHLDVFEHALATATNLEEVMDSPGAFFPGHQERLSERLKESPSGEVSRRFIMNIAALLHDVAKPDCLTHDEDGNIRFLEHDRAGAEMARDILARLRAGSGTTQAVTLLVAQHLRLGFLLHEPHPSDRARLRYLRASTPYTPEAIMLSVADRLAVRGPRSTAAAIDRHLALAREMMELCFAEADRQPLPKLISGDELIGELGLEPGPLVGELLEHIHEEQRLGAVTSRDEALALARGLLRARGPDSAV